MAKALAAAWKAPLVTSTTSRLLIDLNRSIGNPKIFSAATRGAPPEARAKIVERYYLPYRTHVERLVRKSVSRGRLVIHISSHSFTPELDGKLRRADVGLLYDPVDAPRPSCALAGSPRSPHSRGASRPPQLSVCRQGDGLTRYLRGRFPDNVYAGIELRSTRGLSSKEGNAGWRFGACLSIRYARHRVRENDPARVTQVRIIAIGDS